MYFETKEGILAKIIYYIFATNIKLGYFEEEMKGIIILSKRSESYY